MAGEDVTRIDEILIASLESPAQVQSDAGMVTQHAISSIIQARNFVASIEATKNGRSGLRFSRLIPDGTVQRRWNS